MLTKTRVGYGLYCLHCEVVSVHITAKQREHAIRKHRRHEVELFVEPRI